MTSFGGINSHISSIFQLIEFLNEEFSILRRLTENRNPTLASRSKRFQRNQIKSSWSGVCAMKRHAIILNFQPIDQLHRRLREERVWILHETWVRVLTCVIKITSLSKIKFAAFFAFLLTSMRHSMTDTNLLPATTKSSCGGEIPRQIESSAL